MEKVVSIVVCILCCSLILSKNRCVYLLSLFLAVRILIPETTRFLKTSVSNNTIVIASLILSLLLSDKVKLGKKSKTFVSIIFLYLIYCFSALFLSDTGSFGEQLGLLLEFTITQCLPAVATVLIVKNRKDINMLNRTFLISTSLSCVYGIITFVMKKNPYIEMLTGKVLEASAWKGYATFATFTSTTTFGYFLTLAVPYIVFLLYNDKDLSKRLIKVTLLLAFICVVLCKKRSAMISILGMCLMCLFFSPKTKTYFTRMILCTCVCACAVIIIRVSPNLEKLNNFLTASLFFWNDKAVNVSSGELGSSMELRIRQLIYPFVEIDSNLFFGHGFGWCTWYIKEYLLHPVLYGFESIFATGICELGLMGFIIIPLFFLRLYREYLPKYKNMNLGGVFLLTYIIDIIASGMNYLFLFLLLIVLIRKLKECQYEECVRGLDTRVVCSTSI